MYHLNVTQPFFIFIFVYFFNRKKVLPWTFPPISSNISCSFLHPVFYHISSGAIETSGFCGVVILHVTDFVK